MLVAALSLGGCVLGVRGGPEVQAYSRGPVLTQATVTGVAGTGGVGSDDDDRAFSHTLTVSAGGDARRGGPTVSVLGGLEWFHSPVVQSRRYGHRLGLDVGVRWRGTDASVGEVVAQFRGGPVFRFGERGERGRIDGSVLTLGIEATLGMAKPFEGTPDRQVSFVGGVVVSFGVLWNFHIGLPSPRR